MAMGKIITSFVCTSSTLSRFLHYTTGLMTVKGFSQKLVIFEANR